MLTYFFNHDFLPINQKIWKRAKQDMEENGKSLKPKHDHHRNV